VTTPANVSADPIAGLREAMRDLLPFRARAPWWTSDLQTARNSIRKDAPTLPEGEALIFETTDGSGDRLFGSLHTPQTLSENAPLVLLIHGITGTADSRYIRSSAAVALEAGCRVLRLNLRGAGPGAGTTRKLYHAGRTGDLAAVLAQLPEGPTGSGLIAMGFSLGGNLLLRHLGEQGPAETRITLAAAISSPADLSASTHVMDSWRHAVYRGLIIKSLRREVLRLNDLPASFATGVQRAKGMVDFDEAYTAPANGFASAHDFYAKASSIGVLDRIAVPTVLLRSIDDSWLGLSADAEAHASSHVLRLITSGGGHVGFHDRAHAQPLYCVMLARMIAYARANKSQISSAA